MADQGVALRLIIRMQCGAEVSVVVRLLSDFCQTLFIARLCKEEQPNKKTRIVCVLIVMS